MTVKNQSDLHTPRKLGGVLGGLGPLATGFFLNRIVELTAATTDQEHIDLVVSQRSSTPDRTAAITGHGPSPKPQLLADAKKLVEYGAQYIVVPCNTASFFLTDLAAEIETPVLNIVNETVERLNQLAPNAQKIGIAATAGTLKTAVYSKALALYGKTPILPDEETAALMMRIIYQQIKANQPVNPADFAQLQDRFSQADLWITGCTELSVAWNQLGQPKGIIDSLESLARKTVQTGGGKLKPESQNL